jgi:tRNA modification GTPase
MSSGSPARETIFALSSGTLPAAIAVMRVSGPNAAGVITALAGKMPEPRRASVLLLRDAEGRMLDRALVLWLPGPSTVTGEDLLELHLHGGRAVVAAVSDRLLSLDGVRLAEPGEFTRRAFLNGRLGLDQVEGLADLLVAETAQQHRQAIRRAEGGIGRVAENWRERLLNLAAHVEAALQFGEEEDDVPVLGEAAGIALAALHKEVAAVLHDPPAERLRDGPRVLLAGPVNAGKSSLFNALAGRDAAIVSDVAGTTRDIIEAPVQLGGIAMLLLDTAGLRDTVDPVEQIGVARAEAALAGADIVLWLGEPQDAPSGALVVHARADLPDRSKVPEDANLAVSTITGAGLAELKKALLARAAALLPGEDQLLFSARQREVAREIAGALSAALSTNDAVLLAAHLAHARRAVDRISGRAGVEEMLDALFGRFCIGK